MAVGDASRVLPALEKIKVVAIRVKHIGRVTEWVLMQLGVGV